MSALFHSWVLWIRHIFWFKGSGAGVGTIASPVICAATSIPAIPVLQTYLLSFLTVFHSHSPLPRWIFANHPTMLLVKPRHLLCRLPTLGIGLLLATNNIVASGLSTTALWSSSVSLPLCLWPGEKILALHASHPSTGKQRGRNSQQNYWLIQLFSFTILSREHRHQ